MRFASLGSGSQGNATLVAAGETLLMIDCGFNGKETESRLARLGVEPSAIDAILVTHEHSDHCAGIATLSRRHDLPVFMTHGTSRAERLDGIVQQVRINAGDTFAIGDIEINAIPVPHDAREPVQYCFGHGEHRLGVLTDLGSITPHVVDAFGGCTGLLLEFNHDLPMLMRGPYPQSLKRRVAGDYGHLNNDQAVDFLTSSDTSRLKMLVAGHLSQQNNTPDLTQAALDRAAHHHGANVIIACQSEGFDWLDLDGSPSAALPAVASG